LPTARAVNMPATSKRARRAFAPGSASPSCARSSSERLFLREREAKVLGLQIAKAKLEQDRLRHQITAIDDAMNALSQPQQPAGQPPRQP